MSTSDVDAILELTKTRARIIIAPMDSACDGAELALIQRATALGMMNGMILIYYRRQVGKNQKSWLNKFVKNYRRLRICNGSLDGHNC